MASPSLYPHFETNLMSNRKVIKLLLQLKSAKAHGKNHTKVRQPLVRHLLRNCLFLSPWPGLLPSANSLFPTKMQVDCFLYLVFKSRLYCLKTQVRWGFLCIYTPFRKEILHNFGCLEMRFELLCR